jgi:hypothetical protein
MKRAKMRTDMFFEPLKLLAQELAKKRPDLTEYAALDEKSAVGVAKINALIDLIPEVFPDMKALIPLLERKKRIIIMEGHARWIACSTEITQLGLMTPKSMKKLDLEKDGKVTG